MKKGIGVYAAIALALLFAAFLLAGPARAEEKPQAPPQVQGELPPLDLDRLIEIALQENPELQALRHQIQADRYQVPQARSLPDPMVGVSFNDALSLDSGVMLEAEQRIPWPGKLRLLGQAAALGADRTVTDYTEKAYEVVAQVKQVYYELYFLDKSIEIALANKSVLADFVKIAEAKYAVGAGIQQDVLRAQVAQSRILDDLLMLRQQQISARARLNALLNRPPQAPLGAAAMLETHRITLSESALQQIALDRRAALKGGRLAVAQAQTLRALAQRDLKPDYEVQVGVSPGGGMGAGETTLSLGVMFELPVFHRTKQDPAIAQRAAQVRGEQSAYDARRTAIFAHIGDLVARLDKSDREADLLRGGIIPQAELALESARAAYQVNKADFLTLLDDQMSLYDNLRDYYRAVTDYESDAAELEQAVGSPLAATEVQR